ncbi:UNVERIFIED_CONTAM: hypothetical protein FKN15_064446 [Acipenser sinensis]
MDRLSIKQEQLGDGETGHIKELETVQLKSRGERQRSPEAERMGPGWTLQSAAPDARNQARQGTTTDSGTERGVPDGTPEPGRGRDGQLPYPGGHPPTAVQQYRRTRAAVNQVSKASTDNRGVPGSTSHRPGEGSPLLPKSKRSKPGSSSLKPWDRKAGQTSRAKVATTAVQLQTVTGQLSPMRGRGLLQQRLGLDFLQQARVRLDLAKGMVTFGAGPPLFLDEISHRTRRNNLHGNPGTPANSVGLS